VGTGFGVTPQAPSAPAARPGAVLPFPAPRDRGMPGGGAPARPSPNPVRPLRDGNAAPPARPIRPNVSGPAGVELTDMEIPTFIRRQMD
ncbi:MAG TPA: hypothetical protein PKE51_07675, partial [Gemmatimonadaceae bacterium]|nr:hypothetical protein [Gemmatimonadaceae bacterium]